MSKLTRGRLEFDDPTFKPHKMPPEANISLGGYGVPGMALAIVIRNDATGTEDVGNYDWTAYIVTSTPLARGRLEGFERKKGWEALIIKLAEQLACRPITPPKTR